MIRILVLVLLFVLSCGSHSKETEFWGIKLKDWNGETHKLADYKGKYLVLDIWASWCGPCKEAVPVIEALKSKVSEERVVFFGINTDSELTPQEIQKAASRFGMTYISLLDPELELVNKLKVQGQPTLIVYDPDGRRVYSQMGVVEEDLPDLLKRFEAWTGLIPEKDSER